MIKKAWLSLGIFIPIMLTISLVFSGLFSYSLIQRIRGNARVINYSGVVRGGTQRLVKNEMHGVDSDELITYLDDLLKELQTGNGNENLIRMNNVYFQQSLEKMQIQWASMKDEIYKIRKGEDNRKLYELSESYFQLANVTTGLAEQYTEKNIQNATKGLTLSTIGFILLMLLLCWYGLTQERRRKKLQQKENENEKKSEYLSEMYNEFRTPMDEISELAYISDIDTYEILFLNESTKKIFHVGNDFVNKKCYEVLHNRTSPCPFCTTPFLTPNENYTWEITNPVVNRHYLLKDRLIQWDNRPARLEIAFDITDAENEKTELKNTLNAEKMLVDCIRILYEEQDVNLAITEVLKLLGTSLDATHTYIYTIGKTTYSNTHEWYKDPSSSKFDGIQYFPNKLLSHWIEIFKKNECVVISDITSIKEVSPYEYQELLNHNIESLAVASLEQNGEVSGFVGIDNPTHDKIKNIASYLETLRYFIMIAYRRYESEHLLSDLSYHDLLTSFYNRNRYIKDLEKLASYKGCIGVVFLDLNGLKEINDHYGHLYGDNVLKFCAKSIQDIFKNHDYYRIGGDEFVIICKDISEQSFFVMIRELKNTISKHPHCQIAIGSSWVQKASSVQEIIAQADTLMYEDKKAYYHDTSIAKMRYRHHNDEVLPLIDATVLKEKIKTKQFTFYLQPQMSSSTHQIVGAEALIRYIPKPNQVIPPDDFLPLLEEAQVIGYLDFFVFEEVCKKLNTWKKEGKRLYPISVNFSRCSLSEPILIEKLKMTCKQYDIDKKYLEIEITEDSTGVINTNVKKVISTMREAGFIVVIDDFGTQHANVSLLTSIDIDIIKIDKCLIDPIENNKKSRTILIAIFELCSELNIEVIAEGVENVEQLRILKNIGIKTIQGYLFSKPIPVDEFETIYLSNFL